jgi:hypothetical protein
MSDDNGERDGGAPDTSGDGDEHRDLRLRDDDDRRPGWLSTYGSPLFRILLLVALLVALVVLRKPCADGVAGFVGNFGPSPAGQPTRDGGVRAPSHGGGQPGMTQRAGPASLPRGQEGPRAPAARDAAPRQ